MAEFPTMPPRIDPPTLAEVADASRRAYAAAVEMADVLATLPTSRSRAFVDALLGAVDPTSPKWPAV